MPVLCLILNSAYYTNNYAGIFDAGLSASVTGPIYNKGNHCWFVKLLLGWRLVHCAMFFPLILQFFPLYILHIESEKLTKISIKCHGFYLSCYSHLHMWTLQFINVLLSNRQDVLACTFLHCELQNSDSNNYISDVYSNVYSYACVIVTSTCK